MAKTFFSFDASLNNGDLSDHRSEEEYDARNDETFGGDLPSSDDDWEQQHEQFAEIEENTKLSQEIENTLSQLVLEDYLPKHTESIWSRNGDSFDSSLLSSLRQKVSDSLADGRPTNTSGNATAVGAIGMPPAPIALPPKKICTVEELERNLLKSKQQAAKPMLPSFPAMPHQPYMFPPHMPNRPPPGLHPMPPPHLAHMPPHLAMPPGLRMMPPPHFVPGGRPFPPGLLHPNNGQFPVNHPFNFPPPNVMAMANSAQMGRSFAQQRIRHDSGGGYRQRSTPNMEQNRGDEYAGLMTNREKQWLLNIQLLQLNTGTPYFDDYYYTMYKERKANSNNNNNNGSGGVGNKKAGQHQKGDRYYYNNTNQRRDHKNNERGENQNILTPKVYTPLQFENSLGKLQCGSVTAPRKIIDMDIVTPDKDSESASAPRDTRKSKQILLELEAMYTLFLKAVDLKHPLAISDLEKLREMKQKQRLRELEAAQTPEQKQEVLTLLREESRPPVENQSDHFAKVLKGLLQDEKFASFFNFSKGKMLVMRLLPYLTPGEFSTQLKEMWFKILLSLPAVGRRDTIGDNVLPKFYPHFRSHIETYEVSDLLELSAELTEVVKQDSVRSTPIAARGKPRLHFILSNKFGISAVAALLCKCEKLIQLKSASQDEQSKWSEFLANVAEILASLRDVPAPEERIPRKLFLEHLKRFDALTAESKAQLEGAFTELES